MDLNAYQGYLRPFVSMIVTAHHEGLTPNQIADLVRPAVVKIWPQYPYLPSSTNITYVLRRVGCVLPERQKKSRAEVEAREEEAYRLRHQEKLTLRQIGERIGVSTELARHFINHVERRRNVQAYREKQRRRVEWMFALLQRRRTLGRPIDMGGPRDVWIEKGPWDER